MSKVLLLALCLFGAMANAETKFNISGDAYVRGYFKNSTGPDGTQAFNQFFRINADAKPDEHLTIKTGLVLSSETWEGDSHKPVVFNSTATNGTAIGGTNDNGSGNGGITHLDHAYLEYNVNGWITSIGRMAVSSPGNFLTSDDRRDRIQVLKFLPTSDIIAFVYDKRAEGALNNSRDDLDMYSINYYGTYSTLKYALQTGYWNSKKYNILTSGYNGVVDLDNVKQITPQLSTKLLGANIDFYYTLLWGGTTYYKNDHHAFALKVSEETKWFKLEYQSIITRNGGLVAGGFDTLSSIVNNNLDHNQSSINLRNIGFGLGNSNADESVHMMRISKSFMEDWSASLGLGGGKFYTSSMVPLEKDTIVDATLKYDISKALAVNLNYGKFFGDNKDQASSLTLKANF